jgi:uncharacterized damage-inducible protein DinB
MVPLFRLPFEHLQWADTALLSGVGQRAGAYDDEELRRLLHHILVVQRFFLSRFLDIAFDYEGEKQIPESLDRFTAILEQTHRDEIAFVNGLDEGDLARTVDVPHWPEFRPCLRDLLMQVAMHSEHHRAQCATRLRALGGEPAITDYLMFVKSRVG